MTSEALCELPLPTPWNTSSSFCSSDVSLPIKLSPASGPLYKLFPLPRMLFLVI